MMELNEKLMKLLQDWDPLQCGPESYETEIVDVIQAAYEIEDTRYLAKRIKFIYEFSFEETLPLKECQKIADQISQLKDTTSCIR
jgi:hypothetical protein